MLWVGGTPGATQLSPQRRPDSKYGTTVFPVVFNGKLPGEFGTRRASYLSQSDEAVMLSLTQVTVSHSGRAGHLPEKSPGVTSGEVTGWPQPPGHGSLEGGVGTKVTRGSIM